MTWASSIGGAWGASLRFPSQCLSLSALVLKILAHLHTYSGPRVSSGSLLLKPHTSACSRGVWYSARRPTVLSGCLQVAMRSAWVEVKRYGQHIELLGWSPSVCCMKERMIRAVSKVLLPQGWQLPCRKIVCLIEERKSMWWWRKCRNEMAW